MESLRTVRGARATALRPLTLRCVCNSACDGRIAARVYMPMQWNTTRSVLLEGAVYRVAVTATQASGRRVALKARLGAAFGPVAQCSGCRNETGRHGWALIRTAQPHSAPHVAQPQASASPVCGPQADARPSVDRATLPAAGMASVTILVNSAPTGGTCEVLPPARTFMRPQLARVATRPNARMYELRARSTLARTRPRPQPNALARRCRRRRGLR